jgi:hypothetical protein
VIMRPTPLGWLCLAAAGLSTSLAWRGTIVPKARQAGWAGRTTARASGGEGSGGKLGGSVNPEPHAGLWGAVTGSQSRRGLTRRFSVVEEKEPSPALADRPAVGAGRVRRVFETYTWRGVGCYGAATAFCSV